MIPYCVKRCNCPGNPCLIGYDPYDTDESLWSIVAGTPTVAGGLFSFTAGDWADFIPQPALEADGIRITVHPQTADINAEIRIYAAKLDANNYLFGKIELLSADGGVATMRLGKVVAGTDVWLTDEVDIEDVGAALNALMTLVLCWKPGEPIESAPGDADSYAGFGTGTGWTDPDGVTSPSGPFATYTAGPATNTNSLAATVFPSFGSEIPAGSTITAVAVSALVSHDGMDVDYIDQEVKLISHTRGAVGNNNASLSSLNSVETLQVWGSGTDDWGADLTTDDLGTGFGVYFIFRNIGSVGNIQVRGVSMRVYFLTPEQLPGVLSFSYLNTSSPFSKQCLQATTMSPGGLATGIYTPSGSWDNADYLLEYLYDFVTHPTCPECNSLACTVGEEFYCEVCDEDTPPPGQVTLDLGAGGWTDGHCLWCDTILGEYVIDAWGSCSWRRILQVDDESCNLTSVQLYVVLRPVALSATEYEWVATVSRHAGTDPGYLVVGYKSAPFEGTDKCQDFPVVLNKWYENLTSSFPFPALCNGAMPAFVTLDV